MNDECYDGRYHFSKTFPSEKKEQMAGVGGENRNQITVWASIMPHIFLQVREVYSV